MTKNKEVKQSFYNYDKMLLSYISALNKCDTQNELNDFSEYAVSGFIDAPDALLDYLKESIRNKMSGLAQRDKIDLGKLRAISKNTSL